MTDKLFCSRFYRLKRDADRDAKLLRQLGATELNVTGVRGSWRVRAKIDVVKFAKFCAAEAKRECKKP